MASSPLLSVFGVLNKLQENFSSTESSSCTFDVPKLKRQLNDMVYEVHSPQPGEKPELEVVFFHGLQVRRSEDAYVTTWMTRDNSQLWLQTWLVELFPKARIFTVSYNSSAKRTHNSGRLDMYCTGENLVYSLTADEVRIGQAGCPVVLVGHCLGGLVLKELCLHAAWMLGRKSVERIGVQRVVDLFSNLRGMFFYATPHTGSIFSDELYDCFKGALLEEIKTMEASSARRNQEFDDLKLKYEWLTSGIGEGYETYVECLGKHIHIVPEVSSRPYMDTYYCAAADHYNVCKPQSKYDSALVFLQDFLKKIQYDGVLRPRPTAECQTSREYVVDLEGHTNQLELCFEKEPGKVDSALFIPGLFDNKMEAARGARKLQWKLQRGESGKKYLIYLGRRLEFEDKNLTFLTPGFFLRLQVHLRNYIHQHNWTGNPGFEVARDLICFAENGVEVLVEYSGSIDYFVDILVRSSKPHAVALRFVKEHVVKTIVQFCATPQGCQGILLVEAVIRPLCVKDLHLCMNRRAHSVLVTDLRAHLEIDNFYEHTWRESIERVNGTDFARDLLEGEGSHRRFLRLSKQKLAPEIVRPRASTSSHSQGQKYTNWKLNGSSAELETSPSQNELLGFRRITRQRLDESKQDAIAHQSSQASSSSGIEWHVWQVNDSLFELNRPDNAPTIQIVFFHGLQVGDYSDAHLSTWQSGDGSTLWPQKWLVEEISGAHVLSVSYSGGLRPGSDGTVDMYIIRENLLSDLIQDKVGLLSHCPVVLVGHSIGGMVIKQLCCLAHNMLHSSAGHETAKLERFLRNIKGIFYYAAPHRGSRAAEVLAKNISSPLLKYFEALHEDTARLNSEFERICKACYKDWLIAGLGEGLPTNLGPIEAGVEPTTVLVVPESSSRVENFNVVVDADHFTVCRPSSKEVRSFTKLRDFASQIASKASDGEKI